MAATTAQGMDPAVVDDIIRRLTEVRSARPVKQVCLNSKHPSKFAVTYMGNIVTY
ncbi:hypothetical protein ES288_D07G194000v1 [Gossypium darwinii]|uniref:Uncharacterized protein n=1 Tax=Gossypium darwinii TaxID=34276 RepID=A0A5D2BXL5_GOSDA|nr:hypothetical protein ES288_D13G086900v1 [Gossypium darwinii]TYG62007.1 hypothetical protein ES288_D07G194000v1 [Gossypium darwinii]